MARRRPGPPTPPPREGEPGAGETPGPAPAPRRRLSGRHRATLAAIFEDPTRGDIPWRDIESLLAALGAVITEGRGSRVRFLLNDRVGLFHRLHPRKETDRGAVQSMRRYLTEAGVFP